MIFVFIAPTTLQLLLFLFCSFVRKVGTFFFHFALNANKQMALRIFSRKFSVGRQSRAIMDEQFTPDKLKAYEKPGKQHSIRTKITKIYVCTHCDNALRAGYRSCSGCENVGENYLLCWNTLYFVGDNLLHQRTLGTLETLSSSRVHPI